MSKAEVFQLSHATALKGCITSIRDKPLDGAFEVIIRPTKLSKTLAQLGGLFGVWIEYLSNELSESQHYIHRELKAKFLARIYAADHVDSEAKSYTDSIDQWVELLIVYQMNQQQDKLMIHAKRISLSWANISQMKRFMDAVESHYQAEGYPLPVLDKYRKYR